MSVSIVMLTSDQCSVNHLPSRTMYHRCQLLRMQRFKIIFSLLEALCVYCTVHSYNFASQTNHSITSIPGIEYHKTIQSSLLH